MPDFQIEISHAPKIIAGVDEAGRGPLAGPVVAAAVLFPDRDKVPTGINDSKKLTAIKRDALFDRIKSISHFGIGIVEREKIDEINILQASKFAMQLALEDLCNKIESESHPNLILVDGNQKIIFRDAEIVTVVKGDSKSLSIAAASILAKVTRDRIMEELHVDFPHYNWANNSGYSTPDHLKALETHGICNHHRRTYAPVKKYLVG